MAEDARVGQMTDYDRLVLDIWTNGSITPDQSLREAANLLIEHLHKIQDRYGHLSAQHLAALAKEMRMAQAEVYEVATFYHHFDVVKESASAPPCITASTRPAGNWKTSPAPSVAT